MLARRYRDRRRRRTGAAFWRRGLLGLLMTISLAAGTGCSHSAVARHDTGNEAAPGTPIWSVATLGNDWPTLTSVWANPRGEVYASSGTAVSSITPERVWPAMVVSSHDGGATWTTATVGDSSTVLCGVAAAGPDQVYAVGFERAPGLVPFVARSGDGGKSFGALDIGFPGHVCAVWVQAPLGVLIAGTAADGGFFARSVDAGASWARTSLPRAADLNAIWVSADGTIYLAGAGPREAGPSFDDAGVPPDDPGSDNASPDGAASDAGAAADLQGLIFRSTDGGNHWSAVLSGTPAPTFGSAGVTPAPLFAISGTPDGARIIAVGDSLTIAESKDHGATWLIDRGRPAELVRPEGLAGDQLTGVFVPDAMSDPYMAAGLWMPGLVRMIDFAETPAAAGDLTYTSTALVGDPVMYAVTGTGPDDVWAVGQSGVIAHGTLAE